MSARRKAGTSVRREPDMGKIARGLSYPGIDPRTWVGYATVAAVGGDGAPDFESGVLVTPSGVEVDVVVGLDEAPATCRHGVSFGGGVIVTPIYPGDHVVVMFPDGDLSSVGEVLRVVAGPNHRIPTGEDGLPLFQNDRALIYADGVPLDLRASGGARVFLSADGEVVINEGSKGVARLDDAVTSRLGGSNPQEVAAAFALATTLLGTGLFTPNPSPPPPPPTLPVADVGGHVSGASEKVKAG